MGPPPFGGGNLASALDRLGGTSGFNGATAFRRWKLVAGQGCIARPQRFNGATAFRRWKPEEDLEVPADLALASMGPPPFGGGNLTWS